MKAVDRITWCGRDLTVERIARARSSRRLGTVRRAVYLHTVDVEDGTRRRLHYFVDELPVLSGDDPTYKEWTP